MASESIGKIVKYLYSQTPSNGHLSTTATFLANSPYIDSCLNLSTTATFFSPKGSCCVEFQLYVIVQILLSFVLGMFWVWSLNL